jgi:hypothetical protein
MKPTDTDALRLSFVIAAGIVALGSLIAAGLAIWFLQKRCQKRLLESPEAVTEHPLALLMYGASVVFWPAGLAFTLTLTQAKTARTCGVLTVLHFTTIALATCAGFVGLALWPDLWR